MHLIVGLGNPGPSYAGTRHNIGFDALDHIAEAHHATFADSKWQAQIVKTTLWGKPSILVKPDTYMNESGRAVGPIATYYRIPPEQIVVIHDDLDIELGRIKIVAGRGPGGHNGIASLITHLNSSQFVRIRVGIGRPGQAIPVKNYVLTRFSQDEQRQVDEQMATIFNALHTIIDKGPALAMAAINSRKKDCPPS